MKRLFLLKIAFMLFGLLAKAQNEWELIDLPSDLPPNSFSSMVFANDPGKLFTVINTRTQLNNELTQTNSAIYSFDGEWHKIFEKLGAFQIYQMYGINSNNLYFAVLDKSDNTSKLYNYNGVVCTEMVFPTTNYIGNIVGEQNNLYTFVGSDVYKYNGTEWQLFQSNVRGIRLLIYVGANEIYAMDCWGHTLWNGSTWTWYQSFDFCDLYNGWGMRDENNNLHLYAVGANNFANGLRVWKFIEDSPGSMTGNWGIKYDCTYLCDPPGYGSAYAGLACGIWGSSSENIYVTGSSGYVQSYGSGFISERVYQYKGNLPFERLDDFSDISLPQISNFGVGVTGTNENDVWLNFGYKIAHKGLAIYTPAINTDENQSFQMPISTTGLSVSNNYISYQFNLAYDNTRMQYTGNSLTGTIAEGGTVLVNENTPGNLLVSYMRATALQGEGVLLNLQFDALVPGEASLTITDFLCNNTTLLVSNGAITINDVTPPTASISYSETNALRYGETQIITATFSEPMADSPVPQIVLSGANILAATNMTKIHSTVYTYTHTVSNGSGSVYVSLATGTDTAENLVVSTPTSNATFNVIPVRYGDVDDNTFIRAYDAALVLQYSVGLDPLPTDDPLPWELWRIETANVDAISGITAYDASLILQYSVGLINTFPASNGKGLMKSTPDGNVALSIENNEIVFRSTGDLFGLNVFVNENKQYLGTPQILNSNMILASNISSENYHIGLATPYSPASGDIIMKIPFTAGQNTDVVFDMIVNAVNVQVAVDLVTGIVQIKDNDILLYPNPANTTLFVNGLAENTIISIYDLSGKLILNKQITNNQIDISNFQNGIYTMKIEVKKGIVIKKFIKQ